MTAQGKANYDGYRTAGGGKSLITGVLLPEYDEQPANIRFAWDCGADAVEAVLAAFPADEDAPGNEPETAAVIIVTEAGGRERRYRANSWDVTESGDGHWQLDVGHRAKADDDLEVAAAYAPGHWASACEEGALVPDGTARKLEIALRALEAIAGRPDADEDAQGALDEIADVDL